MFFDIMHLERSRSASYIATIYLRYFGGESVLGAMLCSPLQSQYLADLSAESHRDHRRGGAGEDGMLGMGRIGRLQPEI